MIGCLYIVLYSLVLLIDYILIILVFLLYMFLLYLIVLLNLVHQLNIFLLYLYLLFLQSKHFDRNGHMNNAAYLAALSEYLPKRDGFSLSILYHREIMPEESVRVYWQDVAGARIFQGCAGDEECFRLSYGAPVELG